MGEGVRGRVTSGNTLLLKAALAEQHEGPELGGGQEALELAVDRAPG